jgi:hypothetical protein
MELDPINRYRGLTHLSGMDAYDLGGAILGAWHC